MSNTKKWSILNNTVFGIEVTKESILDVLLTNRGILSVQERLRFINPSLVSVTPDAVGIDKKHLAKALKRIRKAIEKKERIIVFGDYDVDGITGSAILWETIFGLGGDVLPFIPDRLVEGYGLSVSALENADIQQNKPDLIITVDNGISANPAVTYANAQGIDVIITDHHTVGDVLPEAYAIVHTTKLCGAGVAYLLSLELRKYLKKDVIEAGSNDDRHLELASLGTVADLVPLTGANRVLVKEGLQKIHKTTRIGLQSLFEQAGISQENIGVYEIGYIIGPRLNASGRLNSAMDSLRLLCTTDEKRARLLASKLESTNKKRQQLMKDASEHAITFLEGSSEQKKILVVAHETYPEGIIGLIAGRIVEAFYRPAIVLSIGEKTSKASARSVKGFDIIAFLRTHQEYFINVGGHPMAAGFTIETQKLRLLQSLLEVDADDLLEDDMLIRTINIDCKLPFTIISLDLYKHIQQLAPFGMGNFEPVFMTNNVTIQNMRVLGKNNTHLKLTVTADGKQFDAIGFGMGEMAEKLSVASKVDIAYTIDENTWNGNTKIQLKLKDISLS